MNASGGIGGHQTHAPGLGRGGGGVGGWSGGRHGGDKDEEPSGLESDAADECACVRHLKFNKAANTELDALLTVCRQ